MSLARVARETNPFRGRDIFLKVATDPPTTCFRYAFS